MNEPRLVPAPISIAFSEADLDKEAYEREYQSLSESDDDPISQWLKLAKARGETSESDPVLLNLMVELHRKIDALEAFLKNETPKRVSLTTQAEVDSIGFEHFKLKEALLETGKVYYGRLEMPVHPKRDVGVFFEAQSDTLAKFIRIHERDEKEWASYMTARERVQIRELKERNN
ncbi:hypothetical protein [Sulfurimonas sp. C5]|uniref:hypothetical protein n=1 Tax=Sulfurimonas sp. C5 TaxID=3036947 RepID=UPI0024568841|nr:hypothetical protein [Sulfurimonas sp. C5]MDH4945396.1 hypothetical protein [Sulfurimonas sp. C5]